jgi:hypothetical protein
MEILITLVVVGVFVYGVYDFIKGFIKDKSDTKDFDIIIKTVNNLGFKTIFIESGILEASFEMDFLVNSKVGVNIFFKVFRTSAYIGYVLNDNWKQINITKPFNENIELSLQQAKNDIIKNYKKF